MSESTVERRPEDVELDKVIDYILRIVPDSHHTAGSYRTHLLNQLSDRAHRDDEVRAVKIRLSPERLRVVLGLQSDVAVTDMRADGSELAVTLRSPSFPVVDGEVPEAEFVLGADPVGSP